MADSQILLMDIEQVRAETEKLVNVANDRLILGVKHSERRVLKAEWMAEPSNYLLTLECGHAIHCSGRALRDWVLCLDCLKGKLL